jgi:hypothetical protein
VELIDGNTAHRLLIRSINLLVWFPLLRKMSSVTDVLGFPLRTFVMTAMNRRSFPVTISLHTLQLGEEKLNSDCLVSSIA